MIKKIAFTVFVILVGLVGFRPAMLIAAPIPKGLVTTDIGVSLQAHSAALDSFVANGNAYYLSRANHTGSQLAATISDFATATNLAITKGNLTESTSSVLTFTGGTNSVLGGGLTIQVKQAATGQSGYLSSTDWNTFNNKAATRTVNALASNALVLGAMPFNVSEATWSSATSNKTFTFASGHTTAGNGRVVDMTFTNATTIIFPAAYRNGASSTITTNTYQTGHYRLAFTVRADASSIDLNDDAVTAADVPTADAGNYYATDNIEASLQEIGKDLLGAETTVASATTTDLGAVASGKASITGTTTITGFGTVAAGTPREGRFTGALTLTHNATSLILPNAGNNITTAAGDRFRAYSLGSGNWVVTSYTKADGTALVGSGGSSSPTPVALTDGATIALNASLGRTFRVTLAGARALLAPTSPTDGQVIDIEITQDGTGGRTMSLPSGANGFRFGTDAPSTLYVLSTTAAKTDYLTAKYRASSTTWDVLSFIRGY